MKTKLTTVTAILLILAGGLASCKDNELIIDNIGMEPNRHPALPLAGTMWKLESVNFGDERGIVILEPRDCDTCYTIVFDTDSTASGLSIINRVNIFRPHFKGGCITSIQRPTRNIHNGSTLITVTNYEEPFDGNLYSTMLREVHSIDHEGPRLFILSKACTTPNSRSRLLTYKPIKQ